MGSNILLVYSLSPGLATGYLPDKAFGATVEGELAPPNRPQCPQNASVRRSSCRFGVTHRNTSLGENLLVANVMLESGQDDHIEIEVDEVEAVAWTGSRGRPRRTLHQRMSANGRTRTRPSSANRGRGSAGRSLVPGPATLSNRASGAATYREVRRPTHLALDEFAVPLVAHRTIELELADDDRIAHYCCASASRRMLFERGSFLGRQVAVDPILQLANFGEPILILR